MVFRQSTLSFLAIVLLLIAGCSPEIWEAAAAGFAAGSQSSYTQDQTNSKREKVCVKYETEYGWSKGYKVEGTILKGSELNSRTGTYNYQSYSTYVVVFWAEDQASILKLAHYYGSIPVTGVTATDQRNRSWKVSTSSYCY